MRVRVALASIAAASALERVATLREARAPHRTISTVTQRDDPLAHVVAVADGFVDVAFPKVADAWAASLGASVWPSSLAATCLVQRAAGAFAGRRVLELGSGLGLGGVSCCGAGASRVLMTDFDADLAAALEKTCEAYAGMSAATIDWADNATYADETFDVVLGTDVAYEDAVVPALLDVVDAHLADDGVMLVVGERKRTAMRVLRDALPAETTATLDYDLTREVTAGAGDARPLPEDFGIAVLVYSRRRDALDGFLRHLEEATAGD